MTSVTPSAHAPARPVGGRPLPRLHSGRASARPPPTAGAVGFRRPAPASAAAGPAAASPPAAASRPAASRPASAAATPGLPAAVRPAAQDTALGHRMCITQMTQIPSSMWRTYKRPSQQYVPTKKLCPTQGMYPWRGCYTRRRFAHGHRSRHVTACTQIRHRAATHLL